METVLLVITVVSIATTIAVLVSSSRMRQRERERSEARVAALAAAAELHGAADGGWKQVAGEWQWVDSPRFEARASSNMGNDAPVSAEAMFGTVRRETAAGARAPMFAAGILIVMLGAALAFLNSSPTDDSAAASPAATASQPLELVALDHAREPRALTISGTVRNPSNGAKVEGLTAVISLLDRNGALVSTKDVPLDYRALGPGEEAPFKVAIPDGASISRYRVSFRAGTSIVPHVDRRSDTKLASAAR